MGCLRPWTSASRRAYLAHAATGGASSDALDLTKLFKHKYFVTAQHASVASDYQKIEVYESMDLGKLLVIDGDVQLAEGDEAIYHEMMSHVPICVAASRKRAARGGGGDEALEVLVVGGGDCGCARECLRHERVKKVTVVDIDARVFEVCDRWFPALGPKCLENDPRCETVVSDAMPWLEARVADEDAPKFDVIIVDSTDMASEGMDPTASNPLYSPRFNELLRAALAADGVVVRNFTSLVPYPIDHARRHARAVCDSFGSVGVYQWFQPSFRSGHYSALLCAPEKTGVDFPVADFVAAADRHIPTFRGVKFTHHALDDFQLASKTRNAMRGR